MLSAKKNNIKTKFKKIGPKTKASFSCPGFIMKPVMKSNNRNNESAYHLNEDNDDSKLSFISDFIGKLQSLFLLIIIFSFVSNGFCIFDNFMFLKLSFYAVFLIAFRIMKLKIIEKQNENKYINLASMLIQLLIFELSV